jgi:hypothetical protein
MDSNEIKKRVAKLDARETQRLLALLLLDSTVRVRSLLVDALAQTGSVEKLRGANELAHTIAGYILSEGDGTRFPTDRLSDLISDAEEQGLIDWPSFQTRAFARAMQH